jgi:hypothetical protein
MTILGGFLFGSIISFFTSEYNTWRYIFIDDSGKIGRVNELDFNHMINMLLMMVGSGGQLFYIESCRVSKETLVERIKLNICIEISSFTINSLFHSKQILRYCSHLTLFLHFHCLRLFKGFLMFNQDTPQLGADDIHAKNDKGEKSKRSKDQQRV